jgi:putative copper resistance protein D
MSWFYVGSVGAMIGTTYGIMLSAKMIFTLILLGIGLLNFKIVQAIRRGFAPRLICLRCFGEAEIGIGFTVILVAASLTSTAPAIDVVGGRVSPQEIAQRMKPQWPRMKTPSVADLSSATPLPNAEAWTKSSSVVRGKPQRVSSLADIAWSEYNHHWAGLVVLTIGLLALLAHPFRWARHWPLVFLALAVFLLIRADSENWPLGPRGFWESFQVAEVAQHRFFVLLIVVFALFEWSVRAGNSLQRRARLVFPLVCAAGGALLMTHSHSLGNVKEEFLAELSHIPIAIFAVAAGWSRWMEIRVPDGSARITTWIWPVCFALIGAVLMLYREA